MWLISVLLIFNLFDYLLLLLSSDLPFRNVCLIFFPSFKQMFLLAHNKNKISPRIISVCAIFNGLRLVNAINERTFQMKVIFMN